MASGTLFCASSFLVLILFIGTSDSLLSYDQHIVCQGTNTRFTSNQDNYNLLKRRFDRNCTYIDGNLEITNLDDVSKYHEYDLSFLSSIKVITGYLLIGLSYAPVIPLHNLTIIRGRELFQSNGNKGNFSLFVSLNHNANDHSMGLRELQLPNLHDILAGDIMFSDNKALCFDNTIEWSDIKSKNSRATFIGNAVECPPCHPSCNDHCWGEGPNMCQTLTKIPCSNTCDHRCYGPMPDKCCHRQCAGGCNGSSAKDCFACMNFNNEGVCVEYCPQINVYDTRTYSSYINPDGKYSFASLCVKKCPEHFLVYRETCVRKCPPGHEANETIHECQECKGPCKKSCLGNNGNDVTDKYINGRNIRRFKNCTKIDGNLELMTIGFSHDTSYNISALTIEDLYYLKDVKEVTGYVIIQSEHIQNLTFLSNLEYIRGRQRTKRGFAFEVAHSQDLTFLGLRSLKRIYGEVLFYENDNLCYINENRLDLNLIGVKKSSLLQQNNLDDKECVKRGQTCHVECTDAGCWGPGPSNCLKCERKKLKHECVAWCDSSIGVYEGPDDQCLMCDEQCKIGPNTCSGPGPTSCTRCKNTKDGPYCREECPLVKYLGPDGYTCEVCHSLCGDHGCSGPGSHIGKGGCNACANSVRTETTNATLYQCRNATAGCPDGYHPKTIREGHTDPVLKKLYDMQVCYKCHFECLTCKGDGPSSCLQCRHVQFEGECRRECPSDYFADNSSTCRRCHGQCRKGCFGATPGDCMACKNKRIVAPNTNYTVFNCSAKCPPEFEYLDKFDGDDICALEDPEGRKTTSIIIGSVVGVIAAIIVVVSILCLVHMLRQRAKSRERTAVLTAKMQGIDDSEEPLTPSDAKPDLSKLRLIKESEMRQGSIIGSGAFGTVYKGVWIPEGENVKIPVAIKVLQEGTSPNQNKELLEEARVMASVDHVYCVRILAVCMTAQMMLVTQLMPLGCLLDYVRKHKEYIGSKTLLNWCTQIAKGMAYLESRGIVHRDLAARNVLVQNNNMVKITDFGLAKLLDYEESEYHAAGGKMPIKWLALECIQHRLFTHKTDVWSFGVTVWELFTYGQKPYENVRAKDVPELLEKGERLVQPIICTIDVYMIMIKCWMLDADSRPSFLELADEFAKMARDPGRYLVIHGDKLMRLPSQSYDAHDIMRTLSVAGDGPENILDAEEYLMPSQYSGEEEAAHSPTSPISPLARYNGGSLSKKPLLECDEIDAANGYAPRRDRKYGHLEAAAAAKFENQFGRERGDSFHTRYSSDPLGRQMLSSVREGEEAFEEGRPLMDDMDFPTAPPVPLPVDEDDYLQPRSACPQYIDIDENERIEMQELKEKQKHDYENIQEKPKMDIMRALDNPEYFDSIPPASTPVGNTRTDPKAHVNGGGNKSHDYYNELDSNYGKGRDSVEC